MKLITKKSDVLTTSSQWGRGLMFSKADATKATIFVFDANRFAPIHMLFVFYAIDVLWLDEQWKIRDIKTSVRPWTLYCAPKCKSSIMIEFVAGTVRKHRLKIGQKMKLRKDGTLHLV